MAASAARRTGAVTWRQRSAPAANTSATCAGSAARSAYRFWIGSSSATTASVTAALRRAVRRRGRLAEPPHAVRMSRRLLTPGFVVGGAYGVRAGVGVRHRPGDLAAHDVGRVEQPDHPTVRARAADLLILRVGSCEVHHPRPGCRRDDLGDREHRAVRVVEPHRQVARQLDVLALVVADGHLRGPVEQDVGRHQGRVGVAATTRVDGWCLALLLVLDHPRRARRCTPCTPAGRPARGGSARRTAGTAPPVRVEADGEEQRR